jgi:hypothetical protein
MYYYRPKLPAAFEGKEFLVFSQKSIQKLKKREEKKRRVLKDLWLW